MEEPVVFKNGEIALSGLFYKGKGGKGAVITHPHPLYGGDMRNPVVAAVARAYQQKGYSTLRFDFRGTGASTGAHDHGEGEQEDLAAAVDFLRAKGVDKPDIAGYSFGAWVCARCAARLENIGGVVLVAPPVEFVDFTGVDSIPRLRGVVVGEMDEFAPAERLEKLLPFWNRDARLSVIRGADHFLAGFDRRIEEVLEGLIP